jgi:hypothetical protein
MAVHECDVELQEAIDQFDGKAFGEESEVQEILRSKVWPTFFSETPTGRKLRAEYAITDAFQRRFAEEMGHRFGVQGELRGGLEYPGVWFLWRIEQVASDFLLSKDPCLEPLVDIEQPTARVETEDEQFAALMAQVRNDIGDIRNNQPGISSTEIEEKKNMSREYRRAFEYVMQSSVAAGFGKTLEQPAKPNAPSEIIQFARLLNDEIQVRGVPRPSAGFYTLRAGGKEYRYDIAKFQELSDSAVKFELVR